MLRRVSVLRRHITSSSGSDKMTSMAAATHLTLSGTGDKMPVVGLGTWKAGPGVVAGAVEEAIRAGYRHLDCACDYGNEDEVGRGIKAAIDAGVCTRAELWITSKLWNTYHRKEHVEAACRRSLTDLGLDYVDLYLVHFPISLKFVPFETRYPPEWVHDPDAAEPKMELDSVPIGETWGAMEALVRSGLARNIGVCNFRAVLLMELFKGAAIKPAVNQVELHPFLVQEQLVNYCQRVGVALTGFSPLGAGSYVSLDMATAEESVLKHPTINAIAAQRQRSPAQVVLRWAVQRGYSVVPKSVNPDRMRQNLSVFDFELSGEEMALITGLDKNRRYNDPGVFCVGMGCGVVPIYG